MNELRNLLIWLSFDEDGNVDKISNFSAIDPKIDLDKHFAKWTVKTEHRQADVYTFTRENVTIPEHIMAGGINTNSLIMHYNGKRLRAIMPYFVAIGD